MNGLPEILEKVIIGLIVLISDIARLTLGQIHDRLVVHTGKKKRRLAPLGIVGQGAGRPVDDEAFLENMAVLRGKGPDVGDWNPAFCFHPQMHPRRRLVPAPGRRKRCPLYAHDILAKDVPKEIEMMDGHGIQQGKGFFEEVGRKMGLLTIPYVSKEDVSDCTDPLGRNRLPKGDARRFRAPGLDHGDDDLLFPGGVHDPKGIGEHRHHGLLDQKVTAALDRGQRGGGMGFRDWRHQDCVAGRLLKGFPEIEERGNVVQGIAFPDPVDTDLGDILDSDHVESARAPQRFKPSSERGRWGVFGKNTVSRSADQNPQGTLIW